MKRSRKRPGSKGSRYTQRMLKEEREYGFFWYSWLWGLLRPVLVFLCSLIIVTGCVASGANYINSHYFMPMGSAESPEVDFVIEKGSSIDKISENLEKQGLIRSKSIFKVIVSLQGATSKIQFGSYSLSPGMDVMRIVSELSAGTSQSERTITIIPGWTVKDIAAYLVRINALKTTDEFLALCNSMPTFLDKSYALGQANTPGNLDGRLYQLEGYLAPDTYRVFSNATAESLLRTLLNQTDTVFDRVFYSANVNLDYDEAGNLVENTTQRFQTTLTQDQTLILASIIEREAGKKADFAKVSAVFHNRLAKDMAFESDATIAYALGISRLVLTESELQSDSLYNTYRNKGLVPGPICNPSEAALEAALYPDMTYIEEGYLFFCTGDPAANELVFSKTKEEHDAAVAQYRPLWEAYDAQNAGS